MFQGQSSTDLVGYQAFYSTITANTTYLQHLTIYCFIPLYIVSLLETLQIGNGVLQSECLSPTLPLCLLIILPFARAGYLRPTDPNNYLSSISAVMLEYSAPIYPL